MPWRDASVAIAVHTLIGADNLQFKQSTDSSVKRRKSLADRMKESSASIGFKRDRVSIIRRKKSLHAAAVEVTVEMAPGRSHPIEVAPGLSHPIEVAPGLSHPIEVAPGLAHPIEVDTSQFEGSAVNQSDESAPDEFELYL